MPTEDAPAKALTKNPLGPSGRAVAANVERLRNQQNLTFAALSERLESINRPIPPLGLRKIVAETRRVDADDLVGLAVALGVSPVTLLMPVSMQANDLVEITGHPEALSAEELLDWLQGTAPLPGDDRVNFVFLASALPGWEVHKYVEEQKRAQANWLKLRRLQKETQGRIEEVGAQIEGGHGDD